ncbi:hypothetical protein EYB33_03215 [Lysinibacillus sphaericus]|uniref:Uncharacterized protein n=4 Tax=Lysinibacillus TaxID=400634 RepID=A0A2S5D526_LYSSH|nr:MULTISPECIES: hypothetical protein [Lysinibacillus]AHN20447.1 hypothetical protein T479_02465 [Lysinibacillus varians]MCS1381237.1 hypothetical protein [Lysinibacillus sphaericus]OEC00909.1 membrane protein [Lysinibacillus sphaericus]POZ58185.1 hypothetical protein LYSIN_02969 [Lysinibacillus sphaericus]TKI48881.1 hypothetical protein FC748_14810 [Lysinibacillus tabacifolii]
MRIFGMFVAIIASAFMAVGIAEYYDQPYDWYLVFFMILIGFFIHTIILIVESEYSEENEV